jgi:hypothetical protein
MTQDGLVGGAASDSLTNCMTGCDAWEDMCMEFTFDSSANTCVYYSGKCTLEASGAASKDFVYERVPCCYWTSPTLIDADSLCANEADSTMNGVAAGAYNTGFEFSIIYNDNVNYDKESCQKLCVEFEGASSDKNC